MSLLHPALLILTLFIVLRLRSMKIKLPFKFHQKRCHHSVYGAGVGGTTRPRLTLKTIVVMLEKCEMYLLVMLYAYRSIIAVSQLHPALLILTLFIVLHIRSTFNFRIHLKRYHLLYSANVWSFKSNFHHKRCHKSYKTTSYRSRLNLKTMVVMLGYTEKDEMYLLMIIHQHLIISGDVELNPGPLGELNLRSVTNELVSVMAKWYRIGVQLGIDEAKLEEIENNHQTTDRRFSEVIKFWLRGNASAAVSWKSLVEVLEQPFVSEKGLAGRLREKGGMVISETAGIPGATESEVQPQEINGEQRGNAEETVDDNSDQQPERQGIRGRSSSVMRNPYQSPEDLRQGIHTEIQTMKHKFSHLQTLIRENLNVSPEALAAHVIGMYILSDQHKTRMEEASSIEQIFNILTMYWSFLDFGHLENIAEEYCSQDCDAKRKLEQYKGEVQEFCRCRVSELPQGSLNNGNDIEGMDKLVVTLDLKDPSLRYVLNLKEIIANILEIPASKLVLCDIGSGSVVLTFWIATSLGKELFLKKPDVFTQEQRDKLKDVHVVSLEFNVSVYKVHQKAKEEAEVQSAHVVDKPRLTFPFVEKVMGISEPKPKHLGVLDLWSVTNKLVSVMAKWYRIGIQLSIGEAKLEEIENNYQTADRCFSEVISFWLNGNTPVAVSWKSLVEILEQPFIGEKELAMRLREKGGMIVSETVGVPGAAESEVQPQEINRGQSGKKRSVEQKLDDSEDQHHERLGGPEAKKARLATGTGCVAAEKVPEAPAHTVDKPRLTFPLLEQAVEISEEEKERLKQRLYYESKDMIRKFQKLFSATIKSLKERKVTVKELLNHVKCLVAIEPVYEDSKLGQFRCEVQDANLKTIDDVMAKVGEYSSFFNYEILQNIIGHVGGRKDRENLATYLREFAEYAQRKVYECPSEVGQLNETGRSNVFVTLDKSYDTFTVSCLKDFERELAKILNVSVVVLCRIAPGSLQLIFQIPLSIQKTIFPLSSEQEVALTKLGVAQLSCGEYSFTNDSEETEDKGDQSSPEGDSDTEEQSTVAGIDLLSVVGGVDITGKGMRKKGGSSFADSAIGTSVATGATFTGISQFSEDIMLRDLRDEPYLRMEAGLRPTPDDSSGLELHWAAYNGELDSVKQLIEDKELNPLQVDKNGLNALHYTAEGGHLPVMKYLIDQGLNPACQGEKSRTPLHYAAWYKHLELVKYLVGEQQVDPLCQGEDGCTPLHLACVGGDIDIVQYLISEMKKHTSLNSIIYDKTKDGATAVDYAAGNGHLPVVKLFITDLNFDPNTPGFRGRPPLHAAAQGGHLEVVRYLTEELQCDPSYAPDEDKVTPLHAAAMGGCLNVMMYLTLTRRCSPLPRDSHDNTPLHEAASYGQYEAVEFFISELNCDSNTPGQWGRTSLHFASQQGHLNIVQYLIDVGKCSPASLDSRKTTPLHVATINGHLHIVKYLIKDKNCNPLCYDKVIGTPLHWAAYDGQLEVVKYLVEVHKCPVNIRNHLNLTPLELARHQSHANIVEYLSSFE